MNLLTRDNFRESVFDRDNHKCVNCGNPSQDAHHILERRLFPDGGYYLDNGASLCGNCHIKAESTELSCAVLREKLGVKTVILPPHLYPDYEYDKWGNIILANKQRLKGELFFDESVQKILKQGDVLTLFSNYVKYPRSFHLPWSESITSDDKVHQDVSFFAGKEVVVTEKMDGENSSIYSNGYFHARSIDSESHWSQSRVRKLAAEIGFNLPENWRICGENLYATHSIKYQELPSYFLLFSVWNEVNKCLSWDETVTWANLLEIPVVSVLYRGIYDEKLIKSLWKPNSGKEGYVMRIADSFNYGEFQYTVGKFVRRNHIQSEHHWKRNNIEVNCLK